MKTFKYRLRKKGNYLNQQNDDYPGYKKQKLPLIMKKFMHFIMIKQQKDTPRGELLKIKRNFWSSVELNWLTKNIRLSQTCLV